MNTTIRSRAKFFVLFLALYALIILTYSPFNADKISSYSTSYINLSDSISDDLVAIGPGDQVIQSVKFSDIKSINHVDISMKVFSSDLFDSNHFPLNVSVSTDNNIFISLKYNDNYFIVNNSALRIVLPSGLSSASDTLYIKIANESDNSVIQFNASFCTDTSSHFLFNTSPQNKSLVIVGSLSSSPLLYYLLWGLVFVFGAACCFLAKGISVRTYLLLAISFGCLFIIYLFYPWSGEKFTVLNSFNHYYNPSLLRFTNEVWMPSGLVNPLSFMSESSSIFNNDFSKYALFVSPFSAFIDWIYYPMIYVANVMSFSDIGTILSLRIYNFVLCLVLNAFAIHHAKNNKAIIFSVSLLPFAFSFCTGISSAGIVFSVFNLLLAMIFSLCQRDDPVSNNSMGVAKSLVMIFMLFLLSAQNILLGGLALMSIFYINAASFNKSKKVPFVCVCSAVFCIALGLNIIYLITNKDQFSSISDAFNKGLAGLFTDPINTLKLSANSVVGKYSDRLKLSISNGQIASTFLSGIILGLLMFLYSKSRALLRIEKIGMNQPVEDHDSKGFSLTLISGLVLALLLVLSAVTSLLSIDGLDAFICPIMAFLASSVCFRKEYDPACFEDNSIPFWCMMCLIVFLVTRTVAV